MPSNQLLLISLPAEVLAMILSLLPNRDIKSLRLTSRFFCKIAKLRIRRVFLSANLLNISVLCAIADHDTFRNDVVEIIWDDARLENGPSDGELRDDYDRESSPLEEGDDTGNESSSDHGYEPTKGVPRWFAQACRNNIEDMRRRDYDSISTRKSAAAAQLASQQRFKRSWKQYQALLQQQRDVLREGTDAAAFRYGLRRFPSLKRVTVTQAAHGWLFQPLYETPMIRDLAYGFNYPIPRGWPTSSYLGPDIPALPWDSTKHRWRGVCMALRELARDWPHHVSEFIIDAHQLRTGLNCRIFEDVNPEYNNLVALLRRPGFSHIELDLLVGGQEYEGWPAFRHQYLHRALSEATELKHISLGTDHRDWFGDDEPPRLRYLFPVEKWPALQHFGLHDFQVDQDDLVELLARLPMTLRSVELCSLAFPRTAEGPPGQDFSTLLELMRDKLNWRLRPAQSRPRLSIGVTLDPPDLTRIAWANAKVIDDFLYQGGPNPFALSSAQRQQVFASVVDLRGRAIERDAFDEGHEKPYIS